MVVPMSDSRAVRTHTPFLGRTTELELLDELVTEFRLISLVGPGGIGKTRLAREVRASQEGSLDGNILFATLAGATAQDDVAGLAARNAGLASVEALRYGSVDRARLIVLDNCEPALVAAAEPARSLIETDRTTRVVVTTRIPLGLPEERVVTVVRSPCRWTRTRTTPVRHRRSSCSSSERACRGPARPRRRDRPRHR